MEREIAGVKEARYRLLGLQVIPHADGVILRRGTTRLALSGAGRIELLDLVLARAAEGGAISFANLAAATTLAGRPALAELVETLAANGFLVREEEDADFEGLGAEGREDIFFWNHGADPASAAEALAETELVVFGVNHIGLALLGNLRGCGFRAVTLIDHPTLRNLDFYDAAGALRPEIEAALPTPPRLFASVARGATERPTCHVVCSDFGGLALMREWNRRCVEDGIHFYPILLQDEVAHLGPLVVPGAGPCFECYLIRRASHLDDPGAALAVEGKAFEGQRVGGYLQPMARVAADIAAIDLLKFYAALPTGEIGCLIEADLMAPSIKVRNVLKVPRCPVCSPLVDSAASAPPAAAPAEPEAAEESL